MNFSRRMKRAGLTLLELVMVLVILTALAAGVVAVVDGIAIGNDNKTIEHVATETSMREIREAILGTRSKQGAWADLGQIPARFPSSVSELFLADHPVYGDFDPITRIGWRGPYLVDASGKDSSNLPTVVDGWGNPFHIRIDFNDDSNITAAEAKYVSLISYGENETLEFLASGTPNTFKTVTLTGNEPADQTTIMSEDRGDDIVLFFRVADTK